MVYVDEPFDITAYGTKLRGKYWCHMWSDGNLDELHMFADIVGLKRAWFQNKPRFPHYDLTARKRLVAISKGATPMSLKEWFKNHGYMSTMQR